jgi:hypothetical protein
MLIIQQSGEIAPLTFPTANTSLVRDYFTGEGRLLDAQVLSAGTGQNAVAGTNIPGTGLIGRTFFEDWYFRIHVIPATLDIGNLLTNQQRQVRLWNAFFEVKTLTAVAAPDDPGIGLDAPYALPYATQPLELLTYTLTLSTEGAPVLDDSITWTLGGVDYRVPITARRVVVWPFPPNWSNPVNETLEWLTSVHRSYDGTEQRVRLRETPRRGMEYSSLLTRVEAQRWENYVFGWAGRLFAVPLWAEKANLTAPALAGDLTINLPTANRSFAAGTVAVLYRDADTVETLEIEAVTATSLTLKKPLDANWPMASFVYPVLVSALEGSPAADWQTSGVMRASVGFLGRPGNGITRTEPVAATAFYRGEEVYLARTNWVAGVRNTFSPDFTRHESESGVFEDIRRANWSGVVKTHTWLLGTKDEETALRQWIGRRFGQAVPVWMPSGLEDLTLTAPVAGSASAITVRNNGYADYVGAHPARRDIIIERYNGAPILRRITEAERGLTAQEMVLTLDAALGENLAPADVLRISFLGLYRLASDGVTISHDTDSVSTVQANMMLTLAP